MVQNVSLAFYGNNHNVSSAFKTFPTQLCVLIMCTKAVVWNFYYSSCLNPFAVSLWVCPRHVQSDICAHLYSELEHSFLHLQDFVHILGSQ